jgi:hypothetical protein
MHKGPLNKSLLLHKAPSVKFMPLLPLFFIKKTLLKNIILLISVIISTYVLCSVFPFSSEMHFGVIYLETWDSTQPYVAFLTLDFIFVSLITLRHPTLGMTPLDD